MSTKEFSEFEKRIMMQMNSIGIPTNHELEDSKSYDYEDDPTLEYIWVLDDTKQTHCETCLELEGTTYKREEDAPEIPVHENCGCQLLPCVLV